MQKKLVLILLFSFNLQFVVCQNNNESSLYNWHDKEIGLQNLAINNGLLFLDIYPTNSSHRFLNNKEFTKGQVEFDHQFYDNIYINYDLFEDGLLLKPLGENDRNAIIVIKNKVKSFSIIEKKFVTIDYNTSKKSDALKGFYEEAVVGKNFIFYIKYKKSIRNVYIDSRILYDYSLKTDYYLKYKNEFHKIDSKKSLLKLFPEFTTQINRFFEQNELLEKDNKSLFMKNFFNYINGL